MCEDVAGPPDGAMRYAPRVKAAQGWIDPVVPALAGAWPWIAGAAALVAAAAAAAWLLRRRGLWPWARRRLRRVRRSAPRYPVVLAHGLLGFDELRIGRLRTDYFRGVAARLEREGFVVHRCRVAKTASIADRAEELAAFVRELPAPRVNLVAHSMGGLDARWALAHLGLAGKVASLTTVGTPHLGTPLADLGTARATRALWGALRRVGLNVDAFHDLTTGRMAAFNQATLDAPGVLYASVVGAPPARRGVSAILVPTWLWLGASAGGNDGLVPADSQRWGEVVREIAADHFAQIGWSRGFAAEELYLELLRELRARGL